MKSRSHCDTEVSQIPNFVLTQTKPCVADAQFQILRWNWRETAGWVTSLTSIHNPVTRAPVAPPQRHRSQQRRSFTGPFLNDFKKSSFLFCQHHDDIIMLPTDNDDVIKLFRVMTSSFKVCGGLAWPFGFFGLFLSLATGFSPESSWFPWEPSLRASW